MMVTETPAKRPSLTWSFGVAFTCFMLRATRKTPWTLHVKMNGLKSLKTPRRPYGHLLQIVLKHDETCTEFFSTAGLGQQVAEAECHPPQSNPTAQGDQGLNEFIVIIVLQ